MTPPNLNFLIKNSFRMKGDVIFPVPNWNIIAVHLLPEKHKILAFEHTEKPAATGNIAAVSVNFCPT